MNSAITAWALDLSAGHPTRHSTIDEFLNDTGFLVIITKAIDGEISCEVHATLSTPGRHDLIGAVIFWGAGARAGGELERRKNRHWDGSFRVQAS
jgi:hypothetical protein